MGASSSVSMMDDNIRFRDNIYISYADGDLYGETLHDELLNSGYHTLKADFSKECSIPVYQTMVKQIMEQSINVFICVSETTVTSFRQAIEISMAFESNKNIVYIFTDELFTPSNTPYLNGIVRNNIWLPAYDTTTIETSIETLESYNIL